MPEQMPSSPSVLPSQSPGSDAAHESHSDLAHEPAINLPPWVVPLIVAAIVLLDVFSPHISFAILLAVPLVLLAQSGRVRMMWWATAAFVALIYVQFFLKYSIYPPQEGPQFMNVRLLNRTLLAVMMLLLGMALQYWVRSEGEVRQMLSSLPPDQSHRFQRRSRNFDAMLAMVIFPVLVVVIAATDRFSPSNFNLPVLYTLPLFLCAWARNRLMLWCLLIAVLALTVWGYIYGPPPTAVTAATVPFKNRILASCVLVIVTVMLHFWITSDARRSRAGDEAS